MKFEEDFANISPYTDEEAVAALKRLSHHPMLPFITKYLFPKQDPGMLGKALRDIESIDDFQQTVMSKVVSAVVEQTSSGYTYDGIENLKGEKRYLAVSNHRDIILDPAITQWTLFRENLPMTEICVGSNLLSSRTFEDLLRSNRMIKVIRGISARELYLSSQLLSRYIRQTVTSGKASVWIAQREGRTKNGLDVSEQGILKMFDLSGTSDFKTNFKELNIVPMSISYEYEPCDARKARGNPHKARNGHIREEIRRGYAQHPHRHQAVEGRHPPERWQAPHRPRAYPRQLVRKERPLSGHTPLHRPPYNRRLQAVEDQLYGLRPDDRRRPFCRDVHSGRLEGIQGLHRTQAG